MATPPQKLSKTPKTQSSFFSLPRIKRSIFSLPLLDRVERILALEIGDEWLKMVGAIIHKNKKQIRCAGIESIKGLSEVDISAKINQFLKHHNFKPSKVLISHPTQNLTSRFLAVPSTDPIEIKDILELQAVKQTPYTREEISIGFLVLDADPSGYSRVLLAISHRDVVSRYYHIAEMTKIPPTKISIAFEGIRNWYRIAQKDEMEAPGPVTLLLDIDWLTTDLLFFCGDKIIFGRSLSVGRKHLAEQGAVMQNKFLREVQLSVESGQAELKDRKIARIVLTGSEGAHQELVALLSREFSLPCEVVPVFRGFEEIVPETVRTSLREVSGSFASVVGLTLAPEQAEIDLILPEIEIRRGLEERARDLAVLGTILLALITLLSVTTFQKYYRKTAYLEKLRKEYETIRSEANNLERLVAKMRLAREQASTGRGFLDVLWDINDVLPDSIYLTAIQFNDHDSNVTIRGISEEMSAVFQLLSTLEAAPHLEYVKTRNVSKRKIDDEDVAEFEIVANVVGSD